MEASCPSCSSIFPVQRTGLQYCPRCGAQVRVEGDAPAPARPPGEQPPPPPPPPPPPIPPQEAAKGPTPWERRAQLGWFRALWETWKQSLFGPEAFWGRVMPTGHVGDALYYGWILAVVGAAIAAPLGALQLAAHGAQVEQLLGALGDLPPGVRGFILALFSPGGGMLLSLVGVGLSAVLFPLRLLIQAALLHLFCLLFGAAKHGFWATFRVTAYSSGPLVLAGIPCLGILAVIYMFVLQVWGLLRVQQTTAARATLAVLALPVLLCCLGCGSALFALVALAGSLR